jgi:trehalose 6-phosphate synthase/phosphatase
MVNDSEKRLVVISNRLPIVIEKKEEGYQLIPGSGGLVTAFAPVLRNRGGVWMGWTGDIEQVPEEELNRLLAKSQELTGYTCHPVHLTKDEVELYYQGFSNEIIWPLFHDLTMMCNFKPEYWQAYQEVNKKFAETALSFIKPSDFIWVQDYQLMLLGQELKNQGIRFRLGFFLHIPFPSLDIFLKLPWRYQILRALLEYDCIGFQTARDKRNFIHCIKTLLPDVVKQSPEKLLSKYLVGERQVCIGSFPIGIDYHEFSKFAKCKDVAEHAKHIYETLTAKTLFFCLDRLDYTKGIPHRLEAFRFLLKKHPELHKKVSLVQVTVPSRVDIPKYQNLKGEIDRLVGEINSEFTQNGWVPIHYIFRHLSKAELVAYYSASEISLVTSLKDGMNLVAKEYIACSVQQKGVLILSEFAGASAQLHDYALLVNPFDVEGVADAMYRAIMMPDKERKERMKRMQQSVKRYDIYWWVSIFLEAAFNKTLEDFPGSPEYIPPS